VANKDNPATGRKFENLIKSFLQKEGNDLKSDFEIPIGIEKSKKPHKFDLGSMQPPVIVECKAHTWTSGGNAPSAKMSVWNEAMYYFYCASPKFRKIFIVKYSEKNGESLLQYYIKRYPHLIPQGVELWEFDEKKHKMIERKVDK